ncbi:MAG TPA: FAD-dependent oxidoreductase [Verrucomicrobiae bacterium]|nr:FAD-dependent oxidoreductase [Verrucomicrobiae bacterium]
MFDLIIVGGGVSAFTASLYSARRGLKVLVIAKDIGGQANYTDIIENYPGIHEIGGFELVSSIREQAEKWNIQVLEAEVSRVKSVEGNGGFVVTAYGKQYKCKAVILAFGKTPRDLMVSGEQEFKGKGVSYCATCDAPLFKNKVVTVAGYGDLGLDAALLLSKYAKKVYTLSKTDKLIGHPGLLKAVMSKKNVELVPFIQINQIRGTTVLEELELTDLRSQNRKILKTDGLFVELGYVVNSGFVKDLVEVDEQDQIVVGPDQSTSVPGVFASGDVTNRVYKQAVISAGEAATAALAAYDWIVSQQGSRGLTSDWTQIKKPRIKGK